MMNYHLMANINYPQHIRTMTLRSNQLGRDTPHFGKNDQGFLASWDDGGRFRQLKIKNNNKPKAK